MEWLKEVFKLAEDLEKESKTRKKFSGAIIGTTSNEILILNLGFLIKPEYLN